MKTLNFGIDKLANIILFLLSFCLFLPKFNVINSISSFTALLIILYVYKSKILVEFKKIPTEISVGFIVFLSALVIASIGINDKSCIKKAVDYIYYSVPVLLMYFLGNIASDKKWALYGFIVGLAFTAIYGLYDYIVFDRKRLGGIYKQPNHTGSMLAIMLPLTVCYFVEYLRKNIVSSILSRICGAIVIISGMMALFLTGSRGAILGVILAFIISGVLYILKNCSGKKILISLSIVALIASLSLYGLYSLNGNKFTRSYDNERLLLIESSYNMWNDNKICGVGLINWKEQYQTKYILPEAKEPHLGIPHNVVAFYFSTTGLIGGLGYLIFSLLILSYLFKNIIPISSGGLCCLAMLWAFMAISFHGLVDIGITKKEIYRLLCGSMGFTVAIIEEIKAYAVKK